MSAPVPHRQVTVRPTPKLIPLLVLGAAAALIAAVVVVLVTPSSPDYSVIASIGYLTFLFSIPGLVLAALVWLILERRSRRHVRTLEAELVGSTSAPSPAPAAPAGSAAEATAAETAGQPTAGQPTAGQPIPDEPTADEQAPDPAVVKPDERTPDHDPR